MKKLHLAALLLCICVFLSACMTLPGGNDTPDDPPITNDQTPPTPDKGDETPPNQDAPADDDKKDEAAYPAELMVELVVEWEMADTILSLLDDLSELLRTAVAEAGCQLDSVTLTISTAGAYTADSLVDGGIDVAILPGVDIISREERVAILALSDDEIPQSAIAVSLADDDLTEAFRGVLFAALTQTQSGQDFISAVCGEAVFTAPTEEALQAVRDYWRELEESEGAR